MQFPYFLYMGKVFFPKHTGKGGGADPNSIG